MTFETGLQIVGVVASIGVALLAWSLKRNVADSDARSARIEKSVGDVAADVRQLSSTLGSHGERLAAGDEKLKAHENRIQGLEDRERLRGCFGSCRHITGGEG